MGLLTGKEFAEKAGVTTNSVRVYITRNQINFVMLQNEKGKPVRMFDDKDAVNQTFIRKHQDKKAARGPIDEVLKPAFADTKKIADQAAGKKGKKQTSIDYNSASKNDGRTFGENPVMKSLTKEQKKLLATELRKKLLELEKLEHSVEIERMKKEKMQGEAIPSEDVKLLFSQHFKNMTLSFKEEAEKIVGITVKQLGGSNGDRIELVGRLEESINLAIDKAKELTKLDINDIIRQYSNKRGVGEKF